MDKYFSFTKTNLNKLPIPDKGKRAYYYDNKINGFSVAVTDKGTKTLLVYRKINGKPERISIGRYPDISLDEARARAHDINAAIARGENPNVERRKDKEWTLKHLFELYLNNYAKAHKKTWREDEAQYRRYLQDWGRRRLSSLSKADIQERHLKIGEQHGHYAANRLLSMLQMLFNQAREWGWGKPNPAQGVKRFKEKSRERFLRAEELPRFFQALEEETNDSIRDYVWLSLLTGARRSNVLSMRWQDIQFDTGIWFIAETKNGTAQCLPLVSKALNILKERRAAYPQAEFVFPSNSKKGHLTEPNKAWQKLLERAQLKDLHLHDLRRSLGSWQAATGANLSVISKTLNHKDLATTGIYARLDLEPVREAMEKATCAMLEATQAISQQQVGQADTASGSADLPTNTSG